MPKNKQKTVSRLLQGNEACAEGALYAGCEFFAGYPITPSTEVIEYLSDKMPKMGRVFIQMEDEISSAGAIMGARWGGKRSMTATSGPGFTLMQETIGFAAVSETPIVIANIQRGGPSTGQPTKSSQQDIYQVKYGSHGDYEIIALAPSSVQEMFDFTVKAFELSEKYRTPVILLADEVVGHMREKVEIPVGKYEMDTEICCDVSSPVHDFFTGHNSLVEAQLHSEVGGRIGHLPTDSGEFIKKICKKILDNIDDITSIDSYYMDDADIAFVTYGSVARSALSAAEMARGLHDDKIRSRLNFFKNKTKKKSKIKDNIDLKIGLVKINTVWPFPDEELQRITKNVKTVFVPEMNIGKYYREIQRALPDKTVISMPKVGGNIQTPTEILDDVLKEVLANE